MDIPVYWRYTHSKHRINFAKVCLFESDSNQKYLFRGNYFHYTMCVSMISINLLTPDGRRSTSIYTWDTIRADVDLRPILRKLDINYITMPYSSTLFLMYGRIVVRQKTGFFRKRFFFVMSPLHCFVRFAKPDTFSVFILLLKNYRMRKCSYMKNVSIVLFHVILLFRGIGMEL